MYYDHAQAAFDNKCQEQYENLKEKLKNSEVEEDRMIYEHILRLEHKAEKSKKTIEEYQTFFQMLQRLLPHKPSIHDIIG